MAILATKGKRVLFLLLACSLPVGGQASRSIAQSCDSVAAMGERSCSSARRSDGRKKETGRHSCCSAAHSAEGPCGLIEQAGSDVRSESFCGSAFCRCRFERRTPEPISPERDQNSRRSRDRLFVSLLARSLLPLFSPPPSAERIRATRPLVGASSSIQSFLGVWLT